MAGRQDAGVALSGHLRQVLAQTGSAARRGLVLSAYWPIKGEPDLRDLMADLHDAGVILALPVVEVRASPAGLSPLAARHGDGAGRLEHSRAAARRRKADARYRPGPARRMGRRRAIGWAMAVATLTGRLPRLSPRPFTIGIGLQSARLATIFPQPHDIPLNVILTEAGIQFQARAAMTTSAEQMRAWRGPAILTYGFRPFFFGAGVWAALAMVLWVPMLSGASDPADRL